MMTIRIIAVSLVAVLAVGVSQAQTTEAEDPAPQTGETSETPAERVGETAAEQAPATEGAAAALRVLRAYVCKDIEQSEPAEAGRSFIAQGDGLWRLCCFSEIGAASYPDTIVHAWYWGDRQMAAVRLGVGAARWRTWSTKRILADWQGEWHVDILDRSGLLLQRLEFSVE